MKSNESLFQRLLAKLRRRPSPAAGQPLELAAPGGNDDSKPRKRTDSSFEPLEGRIAPAVLLSPNTIQFTDTDGDLVTVKFSKALFKPGASLNDFLDEVFKFQDPTHKVRTAAEGGSAQDVHQLAMIDLTALASFTDKNPAAGTNITITAAKQGATGDDLVNVGYIRAASSQVFGINLGHVVVDGDLGQIDAGDLDSRVGVASITVHSWGAKGLSTQLSDYANTSLESNITSSIGKITVATDFIDASLEVVNGSVTAKHVGKIGSLVIGGDLKATGGSTAAEAGLISAAGGIGSIRVDNILGSGGANSGKITTTGSIGSLTLAGDLRGGAGKDSGQIVATRGIGKITLDEIVAGTGEASGRIVSTDKIGAVKLTAILADETSVGGNAGKNAGTITASGNIGSLTIADDLVGGKGDNSGAISASGTIGKIGIGGQVIGGGGAGSGQIIAGGSIASVTINGGEAPAGFPRSFTGTETTPGEAGIPEVQVIDMQGFLGGTGEFTITFEFPGGESQTSTPLPADASATQIASALNAMTSISQGGGPVTVTIENGVIEITFDRSGDQEGTFVAKESFGNPRSFTAIETTPGGTGVPEVQSLTLEGIIGSSAQFTISYQVGSSTAETTITLVGAATAAEIAEAINALPAISEAGGVSVNIEGNVVRISFTDEGQQDGVFTANETFPTPQTFTATEATKGEAGILEVHTINLPGVLGGSNQFVITYKLPDGKTEKTIAISGMASESEIAAAISALPSIVETRDGVTVEKTGNTLEITFERDQNAPGTFEAHEVQSPLIGGAGTSSGSIVSNGNIGKITLKNTAGSAAAILAGTGMQSGKISAFGNISALTINGDIDGSTAGAKQAAGSITAGGSLGKVAVNGRLIGGDGELTGAITADDTMKSVVLNGLQGGGGVSSGSIIAGGKISSVKVAGSLEGGTGANSASVLAGIDFMQQSGDLTKITVTGSLVGNGESSANIRAGGKLGSVVIGSGASIAPVVIGGTGNNSANIFGGSGITALTINGSVQGGAGTNSGTIDAFGFLNSLKVSGSLVGGSGDGSGSVQSHDIALTFDMDPGDIGKVQINGDITGGSGLDSGRIEAEGTIKSITAGSITGSTGERSGSIAAGTGMAAFLDEFRTIGGIDKLTVNGAVQGAAGIESGAIQAGARIGSATIKGSLTGTSLKTGRDIGSLTVGGSITDVLVTAEGSAKGTAKADLAIGKLTVTGSVGDSLFLAGYDLFGNATNGNAQIGTVNVGGDWIASTLAAGVEDLDGDGFGDEDDAVIPGGSISKIASILIGGNVSGSAAADDHFGFVAQTIGKVKINGIAQALTTGKDMIPLAGNPITDDTSIREVA